MQVYVLAERIAISVSTNKQGDKVVSSSRLNLFLLGIFTWNENIDHQTTDVLSSHLVILIHCIFLPILFCPI